MKIKWEKNELEQWVHDNWKICKERFITGDPLYRLYYKGSRYSPTGLKKDIVFSGSLYDVKKIVERIVD